MAFIWVGVGGALGRSLSGITDRIEFSPITHGFAVSSSTMAHATTIVIRCGVPDCDWGFQMWGLSELAFDACYARFRKHCFELHGLTKDNVGDALMVLNLKKWTLTLRK
jgi:hypothetical protein